MKKWIYNKASVIFWITLAIYILIWLTVSYVGVYVTYVAGPVLVVAVLDIDSQAGITKLSLLTFLLKRWLSPNGTLSRSVA